MLPLKPVDFGVTCLPWLPLPRFPPFPRPPRPLPPRPLCCGVVAFGGVESGLGSLICVCEVSGDPSDFLAGLGSDGYLVNTDSRNLSAVGLGFVGVLNEYPVANGECSVGVSGEVGRVSCFLCDVA